jgi:hypothetical protein
MLRPFRCNDLLTALRTLISEYPIHETLPPFRSFWLDHLVGPRRDRRHTKGAQVIQAYCNFKTKRAGAAGASVGTSQKQKSLNAPREVAHIARWGVGPMEVCREMPRRGYAPEGEPYCGPGGGNAYC